MNNIDLLCDRESAFAYLINCKVSTDKILCGCAWFRGGISGKIELFDIYDRTIASIIIPPQIKTIATFALLTPTKPLDYLELEIT